MAIDRRSQARELAAAHLMALAMPVDPDEAAKRSAIYEGASANPQPVSTNTVANSALNAPPNQQTEGFRLAQNDIRRRAFVQSA